MAADDYQNIPQDFGFPADPDLAVQHGNRPASGARHATPGDILSQGFDGAQNAGDFLGLDEEFTGIQDPDQNSGIGSLDLASPPGSYADDGSGGYPSAAPVPAPMHHGDAAQEFLEAPSAFEFGGDLGSEEGELPFEEEEGVAAPSKIPLFVGAVLMALLTGAGVAFGPRLYSRFTGGDVDTASVSQPSKVAAEKPVPEPNASAGATTTAVDGAVEAPDTQPPVSQPQPLTVVGPAQPDISSTRFTGAVPGGEVQPSVEPQAQPEAQPMASVEDTTKPSVDGAGGTPRVIASFPNLDASEFQWATEDKLELIWRGSEVPLEALQAPAKTIMPRVGSVRVFTTSGDVFEGRLYAVGQNRVWLDAEPGRIGLDGDRVERIVVLPPSAEGQLTSAQFQDAGGKRVRVRVPGGLLYGRVLKTEGEDVTLALDDGGRVRVKSGELQDLGSGRAIVVRR